MDQLDCLLHQLEWSRTHLQGRNHLWRSESTNPVPGSTIQEDKRRQAQSITDAKLQAAVLRAKQKRGPAAQTKVDAVLRFEGLIHDHHFGGLLRQVEEVLSDREALKKHYDAYRKEQVEEDSTLFRLIKQGEFGRVRRLFELGEIKVNSAEPVNLMTGLMKSVQSCRPKIVRLFLENHADANQENRFGQVAFHYLWDKWHRIPSDSIFKIVKLMHTIMIAEALLKFNANPNIPFPENGMTPLHVAAMYGHAQIAQLILMYKGATTIRDAKGRTALDVCYEFGSKEVAGLILNWGKIGMHFGLTEFRRKWEDFFANDQQLRSEPSAEALLTDLAVREIAMADYKVEEVPMLDELMLAEQAVEAKAKKEVEKAKEVARVAELTAMTENAGGKTLALILAEPDKIARGEEAVSMETAMAMNVGRYVNKRKTRAPKRMKEGNSDENNGLLQTMAEFRYKRGVQHDFNMRLAKMAGRYSDPDEMTVEQIFGRKATQGTPKKKQEPEAKTKQLRFDGDGGAPGRALPDVKETEDEGSDSKGREAGERDVGAGAGGGASAGAGAPGAAPRTPASPSGGRSPLRRRDSAGSSGSKRRDSGPPLLRRQSTRDTINTAVTGVSAVSSRAGQALESLRSRRALAARNVAEDCYAGKLKKRYQRGETYIRKYALNSVTMRGSRLKVEDDPMEKKKKLGQRAGEDMDDDNVILALLGGGAPASPGSKTAALKPKRQHRPKDIGATLRAYCEERLLPPEAAKVKEKPKSLLEKQREREKAHKAQQAANKYNVVWHPPKKSMYKSRYGKMEEPWTYAKYDVADMRR